MRPVRPERFETTPARRMLCKPCYKAGAVGLDLYIASCDSVHVYGIIHV